jgi:hypothetical protein
MRVRSRQGKGGARSTSLYARPLAPCFECVPVTHGFISARLLLVGSFAFAIWAQHDSGGGGCLCSTARWWLAAYVRINCCGAWHTIKWMRYMLLLLSHLVIFLVSSYWQFFHWCYSWNLDTQVTLGLWGLQLFLPFKIRFTLLLSYRTHIPK